MAEPFIGEIKLFSCNFAPKGWALCDGALLPINSNQALFAILGTTYGGNGTTTFALPDLRGRVPRHQGNGVTLGQAAGEEGHTLTQAEMPMHNHLAYASSQTGTTKSAEGGVWAQTDFEKYAPTADQVMSGQALSTSGGSQPHSNMQPYLALNFCIAVVGIFPSQN